ncbi:MAG: inner membrane-spanning protein YciB [Pseudomonadota bacterium]
MQVLLDYLPVVAFIGAYALTKDFFIATAVLMAAMPIMLVGGFVLTKKINKIHLFSTALVLILGGVTLVFRNPLFIAWKPTALNWALGIACFASCVIGDKPLMQRFLGNSVELSAPQWRGLTVAWGVFFAVVGAVNLFVYYSFSESTWVYFKLWGLMGMTFVFAIAQAIWMTQALARNERAAATTQEQQ